MAEALAAEMLTEVRHERIDPHAFDRFAVTMQGFEFAAALSRRDVASWRLCSK